MANESPEELTDIRTAKGERVYFTSIENPQYLANLIQKYFVTKIPEGTSAQPFRIITFEGFMYRQTLQVILNFI